jgi:membrane protease YdiL (CAAX protease family)
MTPSTSTESPALRSSLEAYLLFLVALELVLTIGGVAQLCSLSLGLAITELVTILLPAVWLVRMRKLRLQEAWRIHAIPWPWFFCSLLLSAFAFPVLLAIDNATLPVITALFGQSPDLSALAENSHRSGIGLLWWLTVGALLPGICEEALFRGSILGVLERKGPVKAGLGLGFVVIRSQSIIPAILWHASTNAMAFTLLEKRDEFPWWITLSSAIGLLAVGWWFLNLTRQQVGAPSLLTQDLSPARNKDFATVGLDIQQDA